MGFERNIDKSPVYPASYTDSNILDKPPALGDKLAYDGRLKAQKALAAIGSLVN
jgi:hypothetical protein